PAPGHAPQVRAAPVAPGPPLDLSPGVGPVHPRPAVVPRSPPRAGPGDVGLARTMAGLTAHVDLRPRRPIAIDVRLVVLLQVGRVAGRAHRVPALVAAGPVQDVARRRLLLGIEVEPAPAPRVPGGRDGLEPTP